MPSVQYIERRHRDGEHAVQKRMRNLPIFMTNIYLFSTSLFLKMLGQVMSNNRSHFSLKHKESAVKLHNRLTIRLLFLLGYYGLSVIHIILLVIRHTYASHGTLQYCSMHFSVEAAARPARYRHGKCECLP